MHLKTRVKNAMSAIRVMQEHMASENNPADQAINHELAQIANSFAKELGLEGKIAIYNSKQETQLLGIISPVPDILVKISDGVKYNIFVSHSLFTERLIIPGGFGTKLLEAVIAHEIGHAYHYENGNTLHMDGYNRHLTAELEADAIIVKLLGIEAAIELMVALGTLTKHSDESRARMQALKQHDGYDEHFAKIVTASEKYMEEQKAAKDEAV